jgi:hypothetical protein
MPQQSARFGLGQLYCTPGARTALNEAQTDGLALVVRHVTGDWSEMEAADQQANQRAVEEGGRIFSAYHLSTGVKLWIITEADRGATTLLLPAEY